MRKSIDQHQPFVIEGFANAWSLFQQVSGEQAGEKRIALFSRLLAGSTIRFTHVPAEQKGDIGLGDNLRANFRFNDRETSAEEFLQFVDQLITAPTGECAYAQPLDLESYPKLHAMVPRLDELGKLYPNGKEISDSFLELMCRECRACGSISPITGSGA